MKPMDISKLSLAELKATVYDQLVLIERAQKNVQALNQEIIGRGDPLPQIKKEKAEKDDGNNRRGK